VTERRSQRGGDAALDRLLADELPRLRAFVRAHLSPQLRLRESGSDVVQSVCRALLAGRGEFDFRGDAQFRAWLFTAARNKIAEKMRFHLRQQRDLRREVSPQSHADLASGYRTVTTPSHVAAAREHVEKIEQALDLLSDDHREVISLVRVAGLSVAEAAAAMDRTPEAVRMLLGRALLKLAAALRSVGLAPPAG
jgi:RNA polymerase sigma-70 factor (subfamily 1)